MNDTLRNRLIGLAVVLVVLFLLSWLIPRHPTPAADGRGAIPVTAVPVNGNGALSAPAAAATSAAPAASTAAPAASHPQNSTAATMPPPRPDAAAPVPGPSVATTPSQKPVAASTSAAIPAPQPAESSPAKPDSGGNVVVQVGSYSESANAEKVLLMLRKKGYRGDVVPVTVAAKHYYRVQVGPYADKASAEGALRRLSVDGFKGARVVGG